ncbi:carboxylesterase/lipase family protein [Streptomyces nanhaiensis]|uniref:carboxylesterase/lipase family protein n=1 Tax=Streptomyces nanhaiensis TaxID=679319 RepID=UPI00399D0381
MLLAGIAAMASAFGALLPSAAPASAVSGPVVTVAQGRLQGVERRGVDQFLGIPYAAPPVGPLRWKPPKAAPVWQGTRMATELGPPCPQMTDEPPGLTLQEDCLFLNVHTPAVRTGKPMPVMVWFHGGSYKYGTGGSYDPSRMVAKGVVVVTVNSRLGALGYLALPSLSAESADHSSGVYTLMDQQAALRWVRTNAAAFGGDRGNVTVFGESAGGANVCQHMVSPTAAGLFHRAVSQSGCGGFTMPNQRQADRTGTELATRLGCTDAATAADCLRTRPVRDIIVEAEPLVWAPVVGNTVFPRQVEEAFAADAYHHVPVVIGSTRDEGAYFVDYDYPEPIPAAEYPEAITRHFGPEAAARIATEYPLSDYPSPSRALGAAMTDGIYACSIHQDTGLLASATPTYAYEFADPEPAGSDPSIPGAGHTSELPYLFDIDGPPGRPFTRAQRALSDTMIEYWTRFARTGNPNGPGTPAWPAFTARTPSVLTLTPTHIVPRTDFAARHRCAFWLPLHNAGMIDARI